MVEIFATGVFYICGIIFRFLDALSPYISVHKKNSIADLWKYSPQW